MLWTNGAVMASIHPKIMRAVLRQEAKSPDDLLYLRRKGR